MKELNLWQIKDIQFDVAEFPQEVLDWIAQENLWNIWVPQEYGGLGLSLTEGLKLQKSLATIDGSLGWTQTLCSGANFFIGNLQEDVAREIFAKPSNLICFGGSGGATGTAEKVGDSYQIKGHWKYATGAPHLSHFTLNARVTENGLDLHEEDGSLMIRSFLLPKQEVTIFRDWKAMGLKTTASHSFEVQNKLVHKRYSFHYLKTYLPHSIFKIPFPIFTDLTLWGNYLGMGQHFLETAVALKGTEEFKKLEEVLANAHQDQATFIAQVEDKLQEGADFSGDMAHKIHEMAAGSIREISQQLIQVYPKLGMSACWEGHPLNQIFRDFFTATQHRNFT